MGLILNLGIRTGSGAGQWLWMHMGLFPWLVPAAVSTIQMFSTSAQTLLYYLDEIYFGLLLAYNNVYIYF